MDNTEKFKPEPRIPYASRMRPELLSEVRAMAARENRTTSSLIEVLVREALQARRLKEPPS